MSELREIEKALPEYLENIEVGVGHPDPDHISNQLEGDDARVTDVDGRPNVLGAPWGDVHTGLYLTLFGGFVDPKDTHDDAKVAFGTDRPMATTTVRLQEDFVFAVCSSRGTPKFSVPGWGISLELPADLAQDPLKKQYIMEHLIDSTKEILIGSQRGIPDSKTETFAYWLQMAANDAIRATGL